ncbi:MAG: leucine/isoleucine/valine transporter permease subunit [Anaerolineae bacterium]|nr:MAG: leucine/isoleucine/valine transporter permease subunit [Anaerolineae bacterium]
MTTETLQDTPSFGWREVVNYGLLGGVVSLYFGAIGMTLLFSVRNLVGTFLNLGQVLALAGALGAGYLTGQAFVKQNARGQVLRMGLLSGFMAGLPPLILVIMGTAIPNNSMFVNINDNLVQLITFGLGPVLGSVALVALSALIGGIGAGFTLLSARMRKALVLALIWVFTLGLFSENIGTIVRNILGTAISRWMFQNKSLNPVAALVVFILAFLYSYYEATGQGRARFQRLAPAQQRNINLVYAAFMVLLALALPWIVGSFLSQVLFIVGLYVIMGMGLNIVVGFAGLLDLGYVAFFAFGAYTMGALTSPHGFTGGVLNFWLALPVSILVGVLFGVILGFPVLNMRGDYLAIVTLGFGEIIRVLAYSNWLTPIMGGAQGVLGIPSPSIFGFDLTKPEYMYYLVLFGGLIAAFIAARLRDSRLGRQWMAMREDEDVAEAMGINLVQTKLLAFAIGAGFSAASGAIFAARLHNIFPNSFGILVSINVLSLIIVGGLGSLPGVVVGAFILVGMPELLREFAEYRLLMYGILLIVMMLAKPEGFWPEETRKRELHADEEAWDEDESVLAAAD